ncbi:RICIN domain-containing protein [Lacticaseibacillus kribbianus]|uniref:RICIN domain-containing protein n=1 Tax=Lacticaseibacillus kribbianus TaxID=2926292 RepID=UPI001CD72550|nr:RICIN domain-containing protein [Lacticaseibacillus kribbianus]
MPFTILLIADLVVVAVGALIFGPRLHKTMQRKRQTANAVMIQNVESGKVVRPKAANIADGTPIVQYLPQNWECVTWQMIAIGNDEYLLKDLYTQKSFNPATPTAGATLVQMPIGGNALQHWRFEEVQAHQFRIRLADAALYLTSPNDQVNAALTLEPLDDQHTAQVWELKPQQPII